MIDGEGYNLSDEQIANLFPENLHAVQGSLDKAEFEWADNPPSDFSSSIFFEKIIEKFNEVKEGNKAISPTLEELKG